MQKVPSFNLARAIEYILLSFSILFTSYTKILFNIPSQYKYAFDLVFFIFVGESTKFQYYIVLKLRDPRENIKISFAKFNQNLINPSAMDYTIFGFLRKNFEFLAKLYS